MKKTKLLALILFITYGCSTTNSIANKEGGIGKKYKTFNPNSPYIYKNGYSNYVIEPVLTISNKDSIYINELRFNNVFSATYTQKLMFDKFGVWDKEINIKGNKNLILIWEKRKLFNSTDVYSIATDGIENMKNIYASVVVFDSKNNDCLTKDHPKKDSIIAFFSKGIINLSSNKKFYKEYRKRN